MKKSVISSFCPFLSFFLPFFHYLIYFSFCTLSEPFMPLLTNWLTDTAMLPCLHLAEQRPESALGLSRPVGGDMAGCWGAQQTDDGVRHGGAKFWGLKSAGRVGGDMGGAGGSAANGRRHGGAGGSAGRWEETRGGGLGSQCSGRCGRRHGVGVLGLSRPWWEETQGAWGA